MLLLLLDVSIEEFGFQVFCNAKHMYIILINEQFGLAKRVYYIKRCFQEIELELKFNSRKRFSRQEVKCQARSQTEDQTMN